MPEYSNILKEVRPKLLALVDELVAGGAERYAVIYMIEKEASQLRDEPQSKRTSIPDKVTPEEPANDWPGAER